MAIRETKETKETTISGGVPVHQFMELSARISRSTIAVIDTIVTRGGFRGEELSTIGQLRDQSVQLIK